MKKNKERDQEQKGKSRRLTLSRETLQALDDPALLGVAQGGGVGLPTSCSTTIGTAC
jgi:hypothetical protein